MNTHDFLTISFFLLLILSGIGLLRRARCKHDWVESYFDLREDEPGGPRSFHKINWTCSKCGKQAGDRMDPALDKDFLRAE